MSLSSPKLSVLTFQLIRQYGQSNDPVVVSPVVDGQLFYNTVEDFETRSGFNDPAGGYGGLIPSRYRFGPLDLHFLGQSSSRVDQRTIVLGCDCGEVGCWPFECEIEIKNDVVTWRDFRQPYREKRDYSQFGPFVFRLVQYKDEIGKMLQAMVELEGER
jgi:hypothetical protein